MISRFLLSSLLITAALFHFLRPEAFDPAIPLPFKWEVNLLVGLLELFLGLGLWPSKFKDLAARLSALWFLLLLPIHIYVSVKEIPMFGISHPLALWARTFLQPFLFFWALSLQTKGWIISQRWSKVLFLHYEVDPDILQKMVPYKLDLFEGKAVVSIVPFLMSHIRFPFLPALPGLSKLIELNLRTYVKVNHKPAVYFFTLDTNHLPGVLVARCAFSLPYRWRKMSLYKESIYNFKSEELEVEAQITDGTTKTSFDRWATERYALVTKRFKSDLWGVVEHEPWNLQEASVLKISDYFSSPFLELKNFLGASYAKTLDVRFRPFIKLQSLRGAGHDES